ncbi:hypothetical protein [Endozoicomonas sp. Mp262]|uniref:hypothetical protein n=1 Tax=Endozoicomonas sp. Mp262 TaxID=2919499 RepID=UPI0021DB7330
MGGYYSGRKPSSKPNIDDLYSLDVCQLYRDHGLAEGNTTIVRYKNEYFLQVLCRKDQETADLQLLINFDVLCHGERQTREQIIRVDWLEMLNGKARRPYFICPQSGRYASKLYLSYKGFAHRLHYNLVYRTQRLGHFDRAVQQMRSIKAHLNNDSGAATDFPLKPKGMHRKTYLKLLGRHQRAAVPVLEKLNRFDLE